MRSNLWIFRLAVTLLAGIALAASLPAQAWRGGSGPLDGTVVDASGKPVLLPWPGKKRCLEVKFRDSGDDRVRSETEARFRVS